jgi:hypothetical protein
VEASVIPVLYQDWLLLLKLEATAFRRGEESPSNKIKQSKKRKKLLEKMNKQLKSMGF